jgi:hypothetical protein
MIPRETKRGNSFKGAGLYYLHDKNAQTKERVAFTHTENLPSDDPELGLRVMAHTSMSADDLKRQAGVARSGRKASKPVYCFSLSWHPEEKPTQEHMIETGRSALAALGLQEHETVMVAHNDEAYSHLHLIVNLVNPEHGKMHTLQYSRRRLSTWAEAYEREHSQKIYCEQRVANNKRRQQGEYVKYEDPELDQKAIITKLYQSSDNGQALQSALAEAGFTICQGKRIVLLDQAGEIHSLARQLEGVREKDVRGFLAGLALPDVDEVRQRQEEERRKDEATKQAAHETPTGREEGQADAQEGRSTAGDAGAPAPATPPPSQRRTPHYSVLNRLQNQQRDELLEFSWETASAARSQLARELNRLYGQDEGRLKNGIALLLQTQRERGRLSEEEADRLDTLQHDLARLEARQRAAEQSLNDRLKAQEDAIKARHGQERDAVYNGDSLPQTEREKQFAKAAGTPLNVSHDREAPAADPARDAFLDRLQARPKRGLTQEWRSSQDRLTRAEVTPAFAQAAAEHTPDEVALESFLDRLDEGKAHEYAPVSPASTSQVEDEYATSLSAEFDAASGEGYSESAGRDAFLDRMGGGGLEQGLSLGQG